MPPSLACLMRNFLPRIGLRSARYRLAPGSDWRHAAMQGSWPRSARRHFAFCTGKSAVFPATSNMLLRSPGHRIRCSPDWKVVLQRIDDDANVPRPDDQISGVRVADAGKIPTPGKQLEGTGIRVFKTGAAVNRMNQVRTILRPGAQLAACRSSAASAMERSFIHRQQPCGGGLFRRCIGDLRPCRRHSQQAHQAKSKGKTSARHSAAIGASSCARHADLLPNASAEESALFF